MTNQPIKALFFDIDGTLVSIRTHRIPDSTIQAVRKAREMGVKVFIATGRPLPFINNLEGFEYDGLMCTNGAYCIDGEGREIHSNAVCREDVQRLIEYQRHHPMPVTFAGKDMAFMVGTEGGMDSAREIHEMLDIQLPKMLPIETALDMDVMQIIAFFGPDDEPRIMTDVLCNCSAKRWHPLFTDCVAKGTNKATGMDAMLSHYGISLSETMAFGDGGNDIEMLRHAAIGVAMGNATDDVKAAADFVTSSVDEDGIALALQRFITL